MALFGAISESEMQKIQNWVMEIQGDVHKKVAQQSEIYEFDFFKESPKSPHRKYHWELNNAKTNSEKQSFLGRSTASTFCLDELTQQIPDITEKEVILF